MRMATTSASSAIEIRRQPNLSDPIWTVEHVATCFGLSVDRTRDYTREEGFPAARRLAGDAGRLYWHRDAVLDWFLQLPIVTRQQRRRTTTDGSTSTEPRSAPVASVPSARSVPRPYRRRTVAGNQAGAA